MSKHLWILCILVKNSSSIVGFGKYLPATSLVFFFTQEREIKDLSGGELQRFSIAGGYYDKGNLVGGFKHFLCSALFGEDSRCDAYFSKGLVQPPTRNTLLLS